MGSQDPGLPYQNMASVGQAESPEGTQRRDRAAIAAQACQTCRNRKSKCDEQRPKCGLCRRLNVECQYREPLPTKKDKTMVHILDTLARIENKFDNLTLPSAAGDAPMHGYRVPSSYVSTVNSPEQDYRGNSLPQDFPNELQRTYTHITVPHKILLWPSVYIHLVNTGIQAAGDLQHILQEGTPWFIKQELAKHPGTLPYDVGLPCFSFHANSRERGHSSKVAFPTLNLQQIQDYTEAYFNTFNVLYPILNRESFFSDVVQSVIRDGYGDGDPASVLALLVFALGQVAIEGVFERPINVLDGVPSGIRGGSNENPPGLEIFNEARRRLGFVVSQCSLENVQILLLQATYYEASSRHLDFWRSTVTASMACQVLIKCKTIDWSTSEGDLIKRAYWTCVLSEDLYHLDLDLPQTGLREHEDTVPLPYFHEAQEPPEVLSDERSHFQYHFLAMIALRRLITRLHSVIFESSRHAAENSNNYGGPPVHVIKEMARQLESWRSLLPRPLQWSDNDKLEFPNVDPTSRRSNEPLFARDQGAVPIKHKYNLDIVTGQLRTRFYYARFMMYRPFVYKALHFPELMTAEDAQCCAFAIQSACLWPIAMAPPKNKKRLVPHLFAWTQNFLGILLIFKMATENDCLRRICEERVSREEMDLTARLMLEWVRDVKQVDGIAEWSWRILEPLYSNRTM